MSKENRGTLEVYEAKAREWVSCQYRKHHVDEAKYKEKREQKRGRIWRFIEGMSGNPKLLEIGGGSGEDVPLLESLGCRVEVSDGAQACVDIMREKGIPAFKYDILSSKEIPGEYDIVYASHVLIHMTEEDVDKVLRKVYSALRRNGRFIFNVGNRDGDGGRSSGWVDLPGFHHIGAPRYFRYWKNYSIIQHVEDAGFIVKMYEVDGGDDGRRWIYICAIKP